MTESSAWAPVAAIRSARWQAWCVSLEPAPAAISASSPSSSTISVDQRDHLVVAQRRRLAGRPAHDEAVGAVGEQVPAERDRRLLVHAAVRAERGDHRRQQAFERAHGSDSGRRGGGVRRSTWRCGGSPANVNCGWVRRSGAGSGRRVPRSMRSTLRRPERRARICGAERRSRVHLAVPRTVYLVTRAARDRAARGRPSLANPSCPAWSPRRRRRPAHPPATRRGHHGRRAASSRGTDARSATRIHSGHSRCSSPTTGDSGSVADAADGEQDPGHEARAVGRVRGGSSASGRRRRG